MGGLLTQSLSNEQIRTLAPSAFAESPMKQTKIYGFIDSVAVLDGLRGAGWQPVTARQQHVLTSDREGFQRHEIRFARTEDLALTGKDASRVELLLINSHDGTCGYQLHAAVWRQICGNGLVIADATIARVSIWHLHSNGRRVVDASLKIAGLIPAIHQRISAMQTRRLSPPELNRFAREAAALRWENPDAAPIRPSLLLETRRHEDDTRDLWTVFNRVQENLMRGGQKDQQKRQPSRPHLPTRPLGGIDSNLRVNKGLWQLAESYLPAAAREPMLALG